MDARAQRSRDALAKAVLGLAAERDASELTASEVATRAGVHRSTFYEHASSPVDLLHSVLREELDAIRTEHLGDGADAAAVTATTLAVLDHIDSHAVIYRRGLGDDSGESSLHALLARHFRESIDLLESTRMVDIPFVIEGPPREIVRDAVSHFMAEGAVGAMAVWIRTDAPRDPRWFLEVYAHLVPAWWPLDRAG